VVTPLVGRDAELDLIVSALARVRRAGPASFVLAGSPGVGKSRLAAESGVAAERYGLTSTLVTATRAASTIPFAPFARFVPSADSAPADLFGLLRRLTEAVVAHCDGPLLLVVDDAHLLDEGSATLLHQLVETGACSTIATVRSAHSTPDPVTALWKDELAIRIDLDPLGSDAIAELAAALLDGEVAGATVRRLAEASGGNPLWLRELVLGAVRSGDLVDDAGIWTLRRPLTASDRLAELIEVRLRELPESTARAVEVLAAAEPLELELLTAVAGTESVEEAERQGLVIVAEPHGRLEARLVHPLYGDVLRARLPRSRLRSLYAGLVEALSATGPTDVDDLLRLATWQLDGGLTGDPAALGRAARRAAQMADKVLGARLAQAAFDAGGGIEAGLALAVAKFSAGDHEFAEQVLVDLLPLCADDVEIAAVTGARSYNLGTLMGQPAQAEVVLDQALATVTDDAARLSLLGRLAVKQAFEGRPQDAVLTASELLASSSDEAVSRGAYAASLAYSMLGWHDEAIRISAAGHDAHLRAAERIHQAPDVALIGTVLANTGAGNLAAALRGATTGYRGFVAADDAEGQASFLTLRGPILVTQGQLADASRDFRESATINRRLKDHAALRWSLGGVALADGMAGHGDSAAAAVAELGELSQNSVAIFEYDVVQRGRAWALAAQGRLPDATAVLRETADTARRTGQLMPAAILLHDLARLGAAESVAPALRELTALIDGDLVKLLAAHAEALAAKSAPDLTATSEQLEALGALLLAAEASNSAARQLRADGSVRAATAADRRTERLLARCGDISPPSLDRSAGTERLTGREREVAGLAAGGQTAREIADGLVVSVRTVENHLQNAYTKLGVTSRAELARALEPT
jgi:DNA-binding CsgD family transcriptional regulator